MEIIRIILSFIFGMRKDLAIEYSGIDEMTLDELDERLGYNAFDVCLSHLMKSFERDKCGDLLKKIYSEDIEIESERRDRQIVLDMINEHVVFKGCVKTAELLFDKEYAIIDRKLAKELIRIIGEEIEMNFERNNAFVVATYSELATKLNWVGVATGMREYSDGRVEEISFNLLLVDDDGVDKILIYEPDRKRISEDGKWKDYKIYCGGMVVWA